MKRLTKNLLSIVASDTLRRTFGFLAVAYLARRVGVSGFGIVTIGFTVLSYAMMASSAGLQVLGTREVAGGRNGNLVNAIAGLRGILAVLAYVLILALTGFVLTDPVTAQVTAVIGLSVFANAVLLDWYFQGKEQMAVIGLARTASACVYVVLLFALVRSVHDIVWVGVAAVGGDTIASTILLYAYKRRAGELKLRFRPASWSALLRQSLPIGTGSILGHFSINLPPLVLGLLTAPAAVGMYGAASKLVFFLLLLDRMFATLLLPAAARLQAGSPGNLPSRLSLAAKLITAAALPVSVGGTLLAKDLVLLVFGSEFGGAAPVFQALVWYFFFTMMHTVMTSGLIASDQQKRYGLVMAISAGLYAVTITAGTLAAGAVGAAAAVALSEGATMILMRSQLRKSMPLPIWSPLVRALPATAVMGAAVVLLPPFHVLLRVFIGFLVYSASLWVTRGLTREDLAQLKERL